jgi:hypothetical protein
LSTAFGYGTWRLWQVTALVMAALLAVSIVLLGLIWLRVPKERLRSVGLISVIASLVVLAIGIARGRAELGYYAGLQLRYGIFAVPALCACYFAWELYGPRKFQGVAPLALAFLVAFIFVVNIPGGIGEGRRHSARFEKSETDLLQGRPLYWLVGRYTPSYFSMQNGLSTYLRMLRRARIPPCQDLREDVPLIQVPLRLEPTVTDQMSWSKGTATATGARSSLTFELPEPQFVAGIQITYTHANATRSPPVFQLFWQKTFDTGFDEDQQYAHEPLETGPDNIATIWIADSIKAIRIHPDNQPHTFTINKIVLLIPGNHD